MREEKKSNYRLGLDERRELLSLASFSVDENRVWTHKDGRSIGEGVISALVDSAFLRYVGLEAPPQAKTARGGEGRRKRQSTVS